MVWFAFVGITPRSGDQWTDEVKTFFSRRVIDKTFVVYVQPVMDAVSASSATEDCRTVLLVESLPNKTFVYVRSVLVDKCPDVKQLRM